jgi:AraC family transcriptional regulator
MGRSNLATRDPISGRPVAAVADANVEWSSGTKWCGVTVEQYGLDQVDTPEFEISDHSLALHLSSPALTHVSIDGQRHSGVHEPGHLTLFPAGVPRQVRTHHSHQVLIIALSPKLIVDAACELREGPQIELVSHPRIHDARFEHIARALKTEAESNYVSGPLFGESLAIAMAAHLLRNYSASRPLLPQHKGGMAPRTLRRVLDYIHENLSDELRMSALALIAGLSQYRFAHNFRRATGLAPHQYVIRARVERGKQMLRETDLSVLEIGHAVGFQSSSRFTSLFRRETGATPSRYRASFR